MPPEKRKATEEVATKHGFKNLEEWIAVANSVAMIYAYVRESKRKRTSMPWLPTLSRRPRPTRSSPTSSARKYRNVPGKDQTLH